MELFSWGSKQWLSDPSRNDIKNIFPQCLTSAGLGLHWSPGISSCPHIPGPDRSFPIVNKHVCSIRHNCCLSRQRECGVHQPLGQNRAPEPAGDISCLGPSRLTVWGSCHIHCSTRCWCPQPCWKGTGASLAFPSVCTDAPVDLATTDLRSHGRRGSQLLQSTCSMSPVQEWARAQYFTKQFPWLPQRGSVWAPECFWWSHLWVPRSLHGCGLPEPSQDLELGVCHVFLSSVLPSLALCPSVLFLSPNLLSPRRWAILMGLLIHGISTDYTVVGAQCKSSIREAVSLGWGRSCLLHTL